MMIANIFWETWQRKVAPKAKSCRDLLSKTVKTLCTTRKREGDENRRIGHIVSVVVFAGIVGIGGGLGVYENAWSQIAFPFTGSHTPQRGIQFLRSKLPGEGIQAGPFRLHPSLGFGTVVTDNVFRLKTDRHSDIGHFIAPGIQAYLPMGERHDLLIDYRGTQHLYQRFSENNVFTQEATGTLKFDFPGRLKLMLVGQHTGGFDPRGSILDLQLRELITWNTNSFWGQAEYRGNRLGTRLSLRSTKWNFDDAGQARIRNHLSTSANVTLMAKATRDIYGTLTLGIADTSYDENTQLNSFAYFIMSGFEIPLTATFTGHFRAGVTVLNFDRAAIPFDEEPPEGLSRGGDTQQRFSMRGDFTWDPSSKINVWSRVTREIRQAAVFNANTYTTTNMFLVANYRLNNQVSLISNTFFSHNEFTPDGFGEGGRVDNLFSQGLSVGYRAVRWLGIRIGYRYSMRTSTRPESDFQANSFYVSIQAAM